MPGFGEPRSKVEVTQLLKAWSQGDDVALGHLTPVVENELRRMAHRNMAREKPGHLLQSAALVEAGRHPGVGRDPYPVCAPLSPSEPGRRITLFWRSRGRRGCKGSEDICRDREARLEICQSLANARH